MNSKTFARLTLLLPFLTLIESIVYFRLNDLDPYNKTALMNINFFWNFFALFWFIPYTILVIYLLIWSRKKTVEQIKNRYITAPLIFMYLSGGLFFLIGIVRMFLEKDMPHGISWIFMMAAMASIPLSLLFGYAFVGVALLLYKTLQKINVIQD